MAAEVHQPRTISSTIAVVSTLTPTQQQVLQALAQSPSPLRVDDLGEQLHLHGNTIRGVLNTLLELDLVGREPEETEKRGRPSWLYEAKASADTQVVLEGFTSLMSALSDQMLETSSDPYVAAHQLGALWGSKILNDQDVPKHERRPGSDIFRDYSLHMAKLRIFLSRLGFQATAGQEGNVILLNQCPLRGSPDSSGYPLVCEMHRGMLNQVVRETSGGTLKADILPNAGPGFCKVVLEPAE